MGRGDAPDRAALPPDHGRGAYVDLTGDRRQAIVYDGHNLQLNASSEMDSTSTVVDPAWVVREDAAVWGRG